MTDHTAPHAVPSVATDKHDEPLENGEKNAVGETGARQHKQHAAVDEERASSNCRNGPAETPNHDQAESGQVCNSPASSGDTNINVTEDAATGNGSGGSGDGIRRRPPRPPGSIRQIRREKRRAGWVAKKALAKERKREEREQRYCHVEHTGITSSAMIDLDALLTFSAYRGCACWCFPAQQSGGPCKADRNMAIHTKMEGR